MPAPTAPFRLGLGNAGGKDVAIVPESTASSSINLYKSPKGLAGLPSLTIRVSIFIPDRPTK